MQFYFLQEIEEELENILQFWFKNAPDSIHGGFIGKMTYDGQKHTDALKGGVLNARILWTFAAAYRLSIDHKFSKISSQELLQTATRAFEYFLAHFRDTTYGGVYWAVNADGSASATRKQIYGLAFGLYGVSEYYRATKQEAALEFAIELFETIEKHSFDTVNGGYCEAFSRDWQRLEDLRLSQKDRNDPKTMNTHLHIVEAYVNLYRAWPDVKVKQRIRYLLWIFEQYILSPDSKHLRLFFDATWQPQTQAISFGHDIEASWLLYEAAQIVDDKPLVDKWEQIALTLATATIEGRNHDGSLNHEYDPETNHWDAHREWWVTAEGMVGYLNAFMISNDTRFWEYVQKLWDFAKNHLINTKQGEWDWGVHPDMSPMKEEDRMGFWKCPYHNARACMEILMRLKKSNQN